MRAPLLLRASVFVSTATLWVAACIGMSVGLGIRSVRAEISDAGCADTASSFEQDMRAYFRWHLAWRQSNDDRYADLAGDCRVKLSESLWAQGNETLYAGRLKSLERLYRAAPEAVSDLAFGLQAEWESRYLSAYTLRVTTVARAQDQLSHFLGESTNLLAYSWLLRTRWQTTRYLQLFRRLYFAPVVAGVAGKEMGARIDRVSPGPLIPAPPAAYLTLAVPLEEQSVEEAEELRLRQALLSRTLGNLSGTATFAAAAERLQAMSLRTGLSVKAKAVLWAGAFVASGAVAWGSEDLSDALLRQRRRDFLRGDIVRRARALTASPPAAQVRGLVNAALELEAELSLDYLRATSQKSQNPAEALSRFARELRAQSAYATPHAKSFASYGPQLAVLDLWERGLSNAESTQDAADAPDGASDTATGSALDAAAVAQRWREQLEQEVPASLRVVAHRLAEQLSASTGPRGPRTSLDTFPATFLAQRRESLVGAAAQDLRAGRLSASIDDVLLQVGCLLHSRGDRRDRRIANEVLFPRAKRLMLIRLEAP